MSVDKLKTTCPRPSTSRTATASRSISRKPMTILAWHPVQNIYARMRTALCALSSHQGAFGFANGVEWYATEKINVHNSASLNWGAQTNQVDHIRRLNHLLRARIRLFSLNTEVKMLQENGGNHVVLLRRHIPTDKKLLVVVNLDDENQTLASWNPAAAGMNGPDFIDLLSDAAVSASPSAESIPLSAGPRTGAMSFPGRKRFAVRAKIARSTVSSAPPN